jgi:hypothetical protein
MTTRIKAALLTLALAGGSLLVGQSALADNVAVSVGPAGGVAFGYNDGYWDRGHAWHAWSSPQESTTWRTTNKEHYYDERHDAHGDGWRNESWWDKK